MPRLLLVICSSLLAITSIHADDIEKPGKDATVHMADPYHFFYESIVKKNDGGKLFKFSRKVFNMTDTAMFVDWKKTNVKGYAPGNGRIISEIPGPSGEFVFTDTPLWFGAAPQKIETKFKDMKKADDTRENLESRIEMWIPKDKEANPKVFIPLNVTFAASVAADSDGLFEYSFSWPDADAAKRLKDIPFRFQHKTIVGFLSGVGKQVVPKMRFGEGPQELKFRSKEAPKYAVATIEIMDQDNRNVLATAPVALYLPKGLKIE